MSRFDGGDHNSGKAAWALWPNELPDVDEVVELRLLLDNELPALGAVGVPDELRPAVAKALVCAEVWLERQSRLGRASRQHVLDDFRGELAWGGSHYDPERGPFERFAAALFWSRTYKRFLRRVRPRQLRLELLDEQRRDRSLLEPSELVAYIQRWRKQLGRVQETQPKAWHVPGVEPEEVREWLLVELVDAMLAGGDAVEDCARPGREATYIFLGKVKDRRRVGRSVYEANARQLAVTTLPPTPEEILLAKEESTLAGTAFSMLATIGPQLTKPTRRWLAALRLEAQNPDTASVRPATVSRNVGRDRSAGTRAIHTLRDLLESAGGRNPFK